MYILHLLHSTVGSVMIAVQRSSNTASLLTQGIPKEKIPSVQVSGDIVLGTFGFQPGAFWGDVWWLTVLLVVFLAATFLLLKYRRQP